MALELRGISKSFSGYSVLDQVDFSVSSGQIHAVVGENGAGKSVLMKVIAGLEKPDSGEIRLDGRSIVPAGYDARRKMGIHLIGQGINLVEAMTVLDNLFLNDWMMKRGRLHAYLVAGGVWDVAAIAATLMLCLLLGVLNGALVGLCRLPGFLITLLLSGGVSALSQTVSKGVSIGISVADKGLIELIRTQVMGIPLPLLIVLAVYAVLTVMMNNTKLGRSICAVGGNPGAARMSGLKPGWVKFRVFLISAVCAGLGGMMFTLRLEAGIHTLGSGWEVDALAAVILGGANIRTGEGSVSATCLGMVLICFIKKLMTSTGLLYQWQSPVTIGLIVILLLAENRKTEGMLLRY